MRKLSEIFTLGLGKFMNPYRHPRGMCASLLQLNTDGDITYSEQLAGCVYMEGWLRDHQKGSPRPRFVYVFDYLARLHPHRPGYNEGVWKLFREFYFFLIWDLARRGE